MLGWLGLGTGFNPHNSYVKKKFKYKCYNVIWYKLIYINTYVKTNFK